MSHVSSQGIGVILDSYADVIEGGSSWRGSGTSFRGIPGTQSNDAGLRLGTDTPLTATAASTTTAFTVAGGSWDSSRWVKHDTPGFFAVCTSATNAANVDAARRITGWDNTTKVFTVDALPAALALGDVFTIRQGFKRIPNGVDIEADDTRHEHGFDRFFHLSMMAGEQADWHGSGVATYKSTLEVRLRFLKYARIHDAVATALENLAIIRAVVTKGASPDHRDGTYTRALLPQGKSSDVVKDDKLKVVVLDRYDIFYRINTTFN
jgi:hypothetical protein